MAGLPTPKGSIDVAVYADTVFTAGSPFYGIFICEKAVFYWHDLTSIMVGLFHCAVYLPYRYHCLTIQFGDLVKLHIRLLISPACIQDVAFFECVALGTSGFLFSIP